MFVWKKEHIAPPVSTQLPHETAQDYHRYSTTSLALAIVGFGPKGLYTLATLQHVLMHHELEIPITVHLFDDSGAMASGPNFDPDQPEFLLINQPIGKINAWKSEEQKWGERLSFRDWVETHRVIKRIPSPVDYASRALVGLYLRDCLGQIVESLPLEIELKVFRAKVTGSKLNQEGKVTLELEHGPANPAMTYDQVMLTTGHSFEPHALIGSGESTNLITCIYPVEQKLNCIQPTDRVVIAGLGLTFVDAVLSLSEGQGGRFDEKSEEHMVYLPSGQEPGQILAYSRSGLPMIPRRPLEGENSRLSSSTKSEIKALVQKHGTIDFEKEVLPLLKKEMKAAWEGASNTKAQSSNSRAFDFQNLFAPISHRQIQDLDCYARRMNELLAHYEKDLKSSSSPIREVSAVWSEVLSSLTEAYNFGGFNADSIQTFQLDYLGRLNQISYGPPLISMRKIRCLAEHGLLKFIPGSGLKIEESKEKTFLLSYSHSSEQLECSHLIQATIPKNDFPGKEGSLFYSLWKSGLARFFQRDSIRFPWPEINDQGNLISKNGNPVPQLSLYGTPTEGMTLDNDSLSRTRNDLATLWVRAILTKLRTFQPPVDYAN
ncbi:FAD/NAD(P)-binding protein [Algoriphagus namhaensis]